MIAMATNEELEHQAPSSHRHRSYKHRSYRLNSNNPNSEMVTPDPDSEPEELSKIDEELARKRRELQQIEKQIRRKKTTIAMKTTGPSLKAKTASCRMFNEDREEDLSSKVDSSVKNTQPFISTGGNNIPFIGTGEKDVGFSCSKLSSAYNNGPLMERVNVISQQRWPDGFLEKAFATPTDNLSSPNPVEKTNSTTLNKDDHPLKLRVKALMNRHCNSGLLDSHGEVPVKPHPPSQSPTTTVVEKNLIVKGFQRFIGVLNEGVDIEMLTKIVKDDNHPPTGQGLLHNQIPVVKEKSGVCKSDSQRFQCGAGQRDHWPCSEERKTELLNQDISKEGCKRKILHEEKSAQSRGDRHFGSSRRSRSPPVVEEKKPKLEQHQEDLQNILKTIGFSLDSDDMCKLTERTQERLYGIKNETKQRLDSTGVSKGSQQHVQSDHNRFSSSTSVSDSPSRHHQHSPSKTFRDSREETQSSEYLQQRSREKGREQRRERDGDRDENITASRDQYPEYPEYLVTYPDSAAASAIPSYTSVQHSEYTAHHSDTSNCVSNDIPPSSSSYPPVFCNYSMMTPLCPSADTGALYGHVYPHPYIHPYPPAGCNTALGHSYFNTNLSLIEGQTGQQPHNFHINPHCQTEVTDMKILTKQPAVQINGQQLSSGKKELDGIEQNSDLSVSEGQTGQQSDLRYLHVINTVQHPEYTDYDYRDTSNSATSTAWNDGSNDIPPSSSCPPGFCNSINLVCPPADTGALPGQVYPHPHPPAGYNDALGNSYLNLDLSLAETEGQTGQKSGSHYIHIINTEKSRGTGTKSVQKENKRQQQLILGRPKQENKRQLAFVRKSEVEQDILKRLEQNSDLSLSEDQSGQQSAVNTVTKVKFQTEEKKMTEQKEGQKESQRSIQGQQLEVELPTEKEINADLTKKEQIPDMSLRQQSGLCYPHHAINTVQHSECTNYHSDTSNTASLTACNSVSKVIPPSSSCTRGLLPIGQGRSTTWLNKELKFVRKCIARANRDPVNNSEWRLKQLAAKEQDILMILKQNSDLSLRKKGKKKMKEQKEGQKGSERSIQGQQLEVELPTEEEINADPTKKEHHLDLPLSEGQTGQQDLCFPQRVVSHLAAKEHAINTVQHSEYTTYHSDTSNGASLTALNSGSKEITPFSSLKGKQQCPSRLKKTLKYVRKCIVRANCDPTSNSELRQKLAAQEQDLLMTLQKKNLELGLRELEAENRRQRENKQKLLILQKTQWEIKTPEQNSDVPLSKGQSGQNPGLRPIRMGTSNSCLREELNFVRTCIAQANCDPANNSKWQRKQLAAKEQYILKILNENSDLSLSEGQTGQQSAVNTVTKEKFHTEEKKMAQQKAGQKESQRSIQGQQLDVELPTEEGINANLTTKEKSPNLPLREGQTGQKSSPPSSSYFLGLMSVSGSGLSPSALKKQLSYVRKCIVRENCEPSHDSKWRLKQLAAKEQHFLKMLKQKSDEPLAVRKAREAKEIIRKNQKKARLACNWSN